MTDRLLRIDEILIDRALSPRHHEHYGTIERYSAAIKAGCTFKPIVVGVGTEGQYVLLDGLHRIRAHAMEQRDTIAVVISGARPDQFFYEAVRLNAEHGRQLTEDERRDAVRKLEAQGYDAKAIESAIAVPADQVHAYTIDKASRRPIGTNVRRNGVDEPQATSASWFRIVEEALTTASQTLVAQREQPTVLKIADADFDAVIARAEFIVTELTELRRRQQRGEVHA